MTNLNDIFNIKPFCLQHYIPRKGRLNAPELSFWMAFITSPYMYDSSCPMSQSFNSSIAILLVYVSSLQESFFNYRYNYNIQATKPTSNDNKLTSARVMVVFTQLNPSNKITTSGKPWMSNKKIYNFNYGEIQ